MCRKHRGIHRHQIKNKFSIHDSLYFASLHYFPERQLGSTSVCVHTGWCSVVTLIKKKSWICVSVHVRSSISGWHLVDCSLWVEFHWPAGKKNTKLSHPHTPKLKEGALNWTLHTLTATTPREHKWIERRKEPERPHETLLPCMWGRSAAGGGLSGTHESEGSQGSHSSSPGHCWAQSSEDLSCFALNWSWWPAWIPLTAVTAAAGHSWTDVYHPAKRRKKSAVKGTVWHFWVYINVLSCWEWEEKIDATLTSLIWS